MIRSHHERLDGSGYPDGLMGESIPLGSRIIGVADTYNALTSTRPHRPAFSKEEALKMITKEKGTLFDSKIVDAFISRTHQRV